MDHVQLLVTGRVDGVVSTVDQGGKACLMFVIVTRCWDAEQPTEMRHPVVYQPVSERQANFLRDTLVDGTKVLASGGMKPLNGTREQASYILSAHTVEVDEEARRARQQARTREVDVPQGRPSAPVAPAPRTQPPAQSRSGWRTVDRTRASTPPAASRPASPSQGERPAPAPRYGQRPASGQANGYSNSNRSIPSQNRNSSPPREKPGPVLDF